MAGNFNTKEWQKRRRNLFEQRAAIDADIKENGLEGKAFAVNVAAFDKWLKAETKDASVPHGKAAKAVAKLIEQTVDQVVYGESLGHDLGMLQNNRHFEDREVENNSNRSPVTSSPPADATGGTVSPLAVPPNPVQKEPEAIPLAEGSTGDVESVTASPGPIHDEPDLPKFLDRRGHG